MITEIPLIIVEMDDSGCHLFAEVTFNQSIKGTVVIDTGASKSVFDKTLLENIAEDSPEAVEIKSAGIEANLLENKLAKIPHLQMNDFVIHNFKIVLLDLSHINQLYQQFAENQIWGLLGGDFLLKYRVQIDYATRKMIINRPLSKYLQWAVDKYDLSIPL